VREPSAAAVRQTAAQWHWHVLPALVPHSAFESFIVTKQTRVAHPGSRRAAIAGRLRDTADDNDMYHARLKIAPDADMCVKDALETHTAILKAYARRLTGNAADADDLLQETMLRCWQARDRFKPGSNFIAWGRTIMRNAFLSARRRDRFHVNLPDDGLAHLPGVDGGQNGIIEWGEMERALGELSPEHRAAVLLAGEGDSIEDAAIRLAIPEGTFKSRLARGRMRLRELAANPKAKTPPVLTPQKSRKRRPRNWAGVMIG